MNQSYIFLLVIVQAVTTQSIQERGIIQDYFSHKQVNRIVGFPCGDVESDFELARAFNEMYTTYASVLDPRSTDGSNLDLRKMLNADYHSLGIFLDTRCDRERYETVLSNATKHSMYGEMHKWLIFVSNLSHSLQILNDDAFSISTDVVIAIPSASGYVLYDIYNPCKERGGSINVTLYGSWNSTAKLIVTLTQSKFERRSNLHGMKLRVGVVVSHKHRNISLHEMMLEYSMKGKYGRSKFLYTLLLHMADLFNFTMIIVPINTQRQLNDSGPVIVALKRKIIDLSASPVGMRAERLNYGDIIGPVWQMRSCFMFRTMSSTRMDAAQFLKPLSARVWYVILAVIIVAAVVLIMLLRLEGVQGSTEGYGIPVLLTMGALSLQGSAFVPTHYAGRIAFLHIMFFSVLIFNYYTASVVSDRLKNTGMKMNDSLISLVNSNMRVAAEPTPYIRSFLQASDPEVKYFYQNRWIKTPECSRHLSLEKGLDRVNEGSLAYHTMVDFAYPYIEQVFSDRSVCELTEVHLFRTTLAFYAKRKSPFTELLKIGYEDLTKLNNVGIQRHQLKRWSARKPFCPNNLLVAEPLSIHEAAPLLIFLCLCMVLSLAICIMENVIYCIRPTGTPGSNTKTRLIGKNVHLPSFKDINLDTLNRFNDFKKWAHLSKR